MLTLSFGAAAAAAELLDPAPRSPLTRDVPGMADASVLPERESIGDERSPPRCWLCCGPGDRVALVLDLRIGGELDVCGRNADEADSEDG